MTTLSTDALPAALPGSYAFVDLETTGCDPARDRILEIAIIAVDDGRVVDEWSRLLDPGTRIPPTIEGLTGISRAMVEGAATFAALREEILERLRGRTLVAHNARFDYGFLRNEFRREGVALRNATLCTLRLARKLFPDLPRHGLDPLIAQFDLDCDARHRALGDARATLAFVARAAERLGPEAVATKVANLRAQPTLPAQLLDGTLDALPSAPGVYLFYDQAGTLLYVGKSTDLHRRVLDHFSGDDQGRRAAELARNTAHVDWTETAGELGALLLEASLVKDRRPLYNRRLRDAGEQVLISLQEGPDGYLEPQVVGAANPDAWSGDRWFGPFKSRRDARRQLQRLNQEHGLCGIRLGLERGRPGRPCFQRQLQRCGGACDGSQSAAHFNLALLEALGPKRIEPWPWPGPIGVHEGDAASGAEAVHVIDRWRHLGTARDESEIESVLASRADMPFDRDHYRVLRRWLRDHPRAARPLGHSGDSSACLREGRSDDGP